MRNRRTKIIATIGPSSSNPEILKQLIKTIDIARFNFSFGNYEAHKKNIENIRTISEELNRNIAILQDIQGPKIRINKIFNNQIELKYNDIVSIIPGNKIQEKNEIAITYDKLFSDVKPGDKILISDGYIELEVEKISGVKIFAKVVQGGLLKDGKGLNIPVELKIPTISKKDEMDINFGLENEVDYIALSFVRSSADILKLRDIFKNYKKDHPELSSFPGIIAKIERPEALSDIEKIIKLSDGIMVARGDLGIELAFETIPKIQRDLIRKCQELSKPVIIATQLLYSMVNSIRPSRSEVDDVYNAVISGADCLMLSDETAVGKHPIKAVETFDMIIKEAEKDIISYRNVTRPNITVEHNIARAVSNAVCELASEVKAKAIVSFTKSGFTALLISKNRPDVDIFAITPEKSVMRKLALYWGVRPYLVQKIENTDEIITTSEKCILDLNIAESGDIIVITAGLPIAFTGITNLIKVHQIN
ncbi:MAG: pyruvate kinase [Candidatus Helarchaeota archaeon]